MLHLFFRSVLFPFFRSFRSTSVVSSLVSFQYGLKKRNPTLIMYFHVHLTHSAKNVQKHEIMGANLKN